MPKLSSQRCRFRFVAGLHGRCALADYNFKHFVLEGRCCPRWINVNGQVVHSKNPLYFFSRMSALAVSMQHLHFSFATHYEAPRFNADFQLVGRKTWHLGTEKDCFCRSLSGRGGANGEARIQLAANCPHLDRVRGHALRNFIGATK